MESESGSGRPKLSQSAKTLDASGKNGFPATSPSGLFRDGGVIGNWAKCTVRQKVEKPSMVESTFCSHWAVTRSRSRCRQAKQRNGSLVFVPSAPCFHSPNRRAGISHSEKVEDAFALGSIACASWVSWIPRLQLDLLAVGYSGRIWQPSWIVGVISRCQILPQSWHRLD